MNKGDFASTHSGSSVIMMPDPSDTTQFWPESAEVQVDGTVVSAVNKDADAWYVEGDPKHGEGGQDCFLDHRHGSDIRQAMARCKHHSADMEAVLSGA